MYLRCWRVAVALCVVVLAYGRAKPSQKTLAPLPDSFTIGRDSFFDFGPPFHYPELISVQAEAQGIRVSRVLITPPGGSCHAKATVESKTAHVAGSMTDLLEGANPCAIPQKELIKEQRRCKHCLVFSGVNVTMQVSCGSVERNIRMDILDRDIYDSRHAGTPRNTSWTMRLLSRLDESLGPGAMDKPAFSLNEATVSALPPLDKAFSGILEGRFDGLFPGDGLKVSELCKQASGPAPPPDVVRLVSSEPIVPLTYEAAKYPPIALAARVGGRLEIAAKVDHSGHLSDITFVSGHPLLRHSAEGMMASFVYPVSSQGEDVKVVLEFTHNCVAVSQ